eukprot:TRINITY_DN567_c0_g1_i3.p1 TRINITY_DN567_c0_g1~~TRINITY_DN567_c0_g1_i3.p1  ORF type:complete len:127 (-),score=54.09 TRINITY_DN567_c0_g1_i3:55-435(-)
MQAEGDELMSMFKWGAGFYEVNKDLFEGYKLCSDGTEVIAFQQKYLALHDRSAKDGNDDDDDDPYGDLPGSDSEDEEAKDDEEVSSEGQEDEDEGEEDDDEEDDEEEEEDDETQELAEKTKFFNFD